MRKLVGELGENPLYPEDDAKMYYMGAFKRSKTFRNEVTFRTMEYSRMYEPGIFAARISPTPILFVVALNDTVTPTDLCLTAYEQALQPKGLVTVPDGHFSPYVQHFNLASTAALDWFEKGLL